MGHGPNSSRIFVLFYVLFVLCLSVYFLCAYVYCILPPGGYPNAVNKYIIPFASCRAIRFHAQVISCPKDVRNVGIHLLDAKTWNTKKISRFVAGLFNP